MVVNGKQDFFLHHTTKSVKLFIFTTGDRTYGQQGEEEFFLVLKRKHEMSSVSSYEMVRVFPPWVSFCVLGELGAYRYPLGCLNYERLLQFSFSFLSAMRERVL